MSSSAWQPVLTFWFGSRPLTPAVAQKRSKVWFMATEDFDRRMRERFEPLVNQALSGELDGWAARPNGRLALILLLDQFCRNLFRGTPRAFAGDARALSLTLEGLKWQDRLGYSPAKAIFFLMPLMHSEDLVMQERGVQALRALQEMCEPEWRPMVQRSLQAALEHCELVRAFGRFPHRNAILGRASTPLEDKHMQRTGQDFGQSVRKSSTARSGSGI